MPTPRPAVKVLIEREGAYLLLEQTTPDGPIWTLPGGKVEFRETPHEALRREVSEEVGLAVDVGPPVGAYDFRFDDVHVVITVFDCACGADPAVDTTGNPADETIRSARWVDRERLTDRPLNSGLRGLLATLE